MSRTKVLQEFKKYKQKKDQRDMEDICSSSEAKFKLQIQQRFLKSYISKNKTWDKILLYHQIGSGKTCTSITIAEQYMKMNPGSKVTVVLPARLRTNFYDELISPCGMEKYTSKEDLEAYFDHNTSASQKKLIKARFMDAISQNYEILSFEKFKTQAVKERDLKRWANKFTKNRLVIIDEVHNLFSSTYDEKTWTQIASTGKYVPAKGSTSIIFKYMVANMHKSGKLLLLTATPIFNEITQFKELLFAMDPTAQLNKDRVSLSDVLPYLKNKVSFFPGTSPNAYPAVSRKIHEIPFSETQDIATNEVVSTNEDETDIDKGEAFMSTQRQISLVVFPKRTTKISDVILNCKEYCPKIEKLLKIIRRKKGKHVVYSSFIKSGIDVIKAALDQNGWIDYNIVKDDPEKWAENEYKVYAVWDGNVKDVQKTVIKNVVNNVNNMDGKYLRVLIGSPSMREGVSFKHVQHLHLMDPVWNISAKTQVEGRAIRFCSHVDIPKDHPTLKRKVKVHIYKSIPRENGKVSITCDQEIYDRIIPGKEKAIQSGEKALKLVAFDHYLFKDMYNKNNNNSNNSTIPANKTTTSVLQRSNSKIELNKMNNIPFLTKRYSHQQRTTCPKPRRPNEYGTCQAGYVARENKHGHLCCYKQ